MSSKHSYIAFYMSDWIAGTAGMPRVMWSLYFQICLYNWDKVRPMPESYLKVIASDLPVDEVGAHLQWMIDEGKLEIDEEKGFFSRRALDESMKAFELWEKKSKGGRIARQVSKNKQEKHSDKSHVKDSSKSPPIERGQEDKREGRKDDSSNEESKPPLPPSEGGDQDSKLDADEKTAQEIADFQAQTAALKAQEENDVAAAAQAWNAMAAAHGFMQIGKMAPKRYADMAERIAKYGLEEILSAIEAVPEYQRNAGRENGPKPNIDWFLRDVRLNKIMGHDFSDDPDDVVQAPPPKPPVLKVDGEPEIMATLRQDLLEQLGPQKFAWFVNDAIFGREDTANGPVLRVSNKGMVKLYDGERIGLVNFLAKKHGFAGVWS